MDEGGRTEKHRTPKKNNKESQFITLTEAKEISGIGTQTLRKMFDNNEIQGFKTSGGQRRVCRKSLQNMLYNSYSIQEPGERPKTNFLYARVSTRKQLDDLDRQIQVLQRPEYGQYTLIQDIGSGINFKRKGLQVLLDACLQGTIGNVVVTYRDRLSRFGFELLELVITKSGGSITVLNNSNNSQPSSREQELTEDLLAIIHVFNCRQMGKRSKKGPKRSQKIQNIENKTVSNTGTEEIGE